MSLVLDRPAELSGWKVLITRPAGQADALCETIERAGGVPVRFPLITIERSSTGQVALARLQRYQEWDWLIFLSPNAVRYALELADWWHDLPARPRIAAIGRGTAERLLERGLRVDLQPKAQFNSESLLDLPEMRAAEGRRFLIVRGQGGRELIAQTLRARGAEVEYAEVYRRAPPSGDVSALIRAWRRGEIDAVTLSSSEAFDNLLRLLGPQDADLLTQTPVAVISERLASRARQWGCRRVNAAPEASDQGLCAALIRLANST